MKFHHILNRPAILVADAKLAHEIGLTKIYEYNRPRFADFIKLLGEGILTAEGDDHKRQRKMMNPAFTHSIVKVINYISSDKNYN